MVILIKEKISSKILNKSGQFRFYQDNYKKIKKENINLKNKIKSLNEDNVILSKQINSYSKLLSEIKDIYISDSSSLNTKKRILFVLHEGTGGTLKTVNDLVNNIYKEFDCYVLTSDTKIMNLQVFDGNEFKVIESYELYSDWLIEKMYIDEYYYVYFKFLIKYNFDIVHIHHLMFHTFDLPKICNEMKIPVILSFHDLYFLCPSFTLLDGDYRYCAGDCKNSLSEKNCFMPKPDPRINMTNISNMKDYVHKWRDLVQEMFSYIEFYISPSNFIKNIFNEYYNIPQDKFLVIEHGIDHVKHDKPLFEVPNENKPVKILFLGNITFQKGVPVIKELYDIDKNNYLEFHFLGYASQELSDIGISHGKYDNNELINYIEQIKPSFIGIFTLTGESYCYSLSEAWSFGIPVLVSKLGALKERVLKNGGGWFIDVNNIQKSYNEILRIIKHPDEYESKLEEIENISLISTESMSNNYVEIYNKLIK